MGNRLCYESGKKFDKLLAELLASQFDSEVFEPQGYFKEMLDYLENDFSKLHRVPMKSRERIKYNSSKRLTLSSLNQMLNAFKLFSFILKMVQKPRYAQQLEPAPLKIRMEVRKFNLLKKLGVKKQKLPKVDSQILLNFLPFQERVFELIQRRRYYSKDY